jgi:hypothetical protein
VMHKKGIIDYSEEKGKGHKVIKSINKKHPE